MYMGHSTQLLTSYCQCLQERWDCYHKFGSISSSVFSEEISENDNVYRQCLREHCLDEIEPLDWQSQRRLLSSGGGILRATAVYSSTLGKHYLFFAPITALFWRVLLGYDSMVFVVVPHKLRNDRLVEFVFNKAREAGAAVWMLRSAQAHSDGLLAQLSRLYAALLPFSDRRFLLSSDVDMFPLPRASSIFPDAISDRNGSSILHLIGANLYPDNPSTPRMYPICYIGAVPSLWRELMDLPPPEAVPIDEGLSILRRSVVRELQAARHRFGASAWDLHGPGTIPWYHDQRLFAEKLAAWNGCPTRCHRVDRPLDRQFLADRLDRGRWKFNGAQKDLDSLVDAHVLRPGFEEDHWQKLLVLFRALLSTTQIRWLEDYRTEFMRMLSERKHLEAFWQ